MECGLRMDNDEGAVEDRAQEKADKYHSARVVLQAGLRRQQGMEWWTAHVSFITGWKMTTNEKAWEANLTELGIAKPKHKTILQRAADAFGSMTDARMGAGDGSIT
eukprot:3930717-Rhodomonas_salina.1